MTFHIIAGPLSSMADFYDYFNDHSLEMGAFLKFFKMYTIYVV